MAENNELDKTLWTAADKLRSNTDAVEYKHVFFALIFPKYISDFFNSLHQKLLQTSKPGSLSWICED